ncbi:MAG: pentapeptide repeat-containing protein [Arenicellales bacterium]|nr:pentapeptide repeat-containing protein [Arenicellales bacterium]
MAAKSLCEVRAPLRVQWLFLLAMGATSAAYAFSPADADKALKANACIKCDLTRVDFHDKHLAGVNLKWARLNSSNLAWEASPQWM